MKKNPEDEDTSEYSEEEEEEEVEEEDEDVDDDAFASEGQDKFPDTLDYGRNKQEYEQLYSMSQGHQGSGQAQESSLVAQFFKRFFVITSLLIFVKFAYPVVMVQKNRKKINFGLCWKYETFLFDSKNTLGTKPQSFFLRVVAL